MSSNNQNTKEKERENKKILKKIIQSLEKVDSNITNTILGMAEKTSMAQVINDFNYNSLEVLDFLDYIGKKYNHTDTCDMTKHRLLFENAIQINKRLPVDKFSLIVLEHAQDIYDENEEYFMELPMPDVNAKAGKDFSMIKCEAFKKVWTSLDEEDKDLVKEKVISLTTSAHIYFIKNITKK